METTIVSAVLHPGLQAALFPGMPNPKLALRKITPAQQSDAERTAAREESDWLARTMRVRTVHTHNDPILDICDVLENTTAALSALKPSADKREKVPSLMDALEMLMRARLEMDDAINVICEALENTGLNWRELPCMQEPLVPTVVEYQY